MKMRVLIPPALRQRPKVPGKRGAPFGNRNAFKHGKFTRERRALYADIREHIRHGRELIAAVTLCGADERSSPVPALPLREGRKIEATRRFFGEGSSRNLRDRPLPEICCAKFDPRPLSRSRPSTGG